MSVRKSQFIQFDPCFSVAEGYEGISKCPLTNHSFINVEYLNHTALLLLRKDQTESFLQPHRDSECTTEE